MSVGCRLRQALPSAFRMFVTLVLKSFAIDEQYSSVCSKNGMPPGQGESGIGGVGASVGGTVVVAWGVGAPVVAGAAVVAGAPVVVGCGAAVLPGAVVVTGAAVVAGAPVVASCGAAVLLGAVVVVVVVCDAGGPVVAGATVVVAGATVAGATGPAVLPAGAVVVTGDLVVVGAAVAGAPVVFGSGDSVVVSTTGATVVVVGAPKAAEAGWATANTTSSTGSRRMVWPTTLSMPFGCAFHPRMFEPRTSCS